MIQSTEKLMRRLLGVPVALLLAACGAASTGSTERATAPLEPTVRDSAGVTIHEHPADALDRAPLIEIAPEPIAVIGGESVEDDVSRQGHFAFLSDGRIVAFDDEVGSVIVYDTAGKVQRRIGRRGEGPGEFATVSLLVVTPADSIVLSDAGTARVSVIAPDSGFVRAFNATLHAESAGMAAASRLDDGRWVLVPVSFGIDPRSAESRPQHPVIAVSESAGIDGPRDTLGYLPGIEAVVVQGTSTHGQRGVAASILRFSALPYAISTENGVALVRGDRYHVLLLGPSGSPRATWRIERDRVPVTSDLIESAVREDIASARSRRGEMAPDAEAAMEQRLRDRPTADSLPAIGRSFGVHDGLWLADYPHPLLQMIGYTRIDSAGRILGRLRLSKTARPMAFAHDRLLLRQEDDDGIITFAVHRLRMP